MSISLAVKSLIVFAGSFLLMNFVTFPLYLENSLVSQGWALVLLLWIVPPVVGVVFARQSLARKEGKMALAVASLVLNVLFILFGLLVLFSPA